MRGPSAEVARTYEDEFDGSFEAPSGELKISTVTGDPLLTAKVPEGETRIRIWRDHPVWPEQVAIRWSQAWRADEAQTVVSFARSLCCMIGLPQR